MTAQCETCGNHYDRCMEVIIEGSSHTFDCFECAIQTLAPVCAHCGCTIIGHGVENQGELFCCDHCARHQKQDESTGPTHPTKNVATPAIQ